eukprot:4207106-Prymnesium_polylepis.2
MSDEWGVRLTMGGRLLAERGARHVTEREAGVTLVERVASGHHLAECARDEEEEHLRPSHSGHVGSRGLIWGHPWGHPWVAWGHAG